MCMCVHTCVQKRNNPRQFLLSIPVHLCLILQIPAQLCLPLSSLLWLFNTAWGALAMCFRRACTNAITALVTLNWNCLLHCLCPLFPHCDFCRSRDFASLCHSQHNTYLLPHYISSIGVLWVEREEVILSWGERPPACPREKLRTEGEMIMGLPNAVLLKLWSLDQQHQHHLGTC